MAGRISRLPASDQSAMVRYQAASGCPGLPPAVATVRASPGRPGDDNQRESRYAPRPAEAGSPPRPTKGPGLGVSPLQSSPRLPRSVPADRVGLRGIADHGPWLPGHTASPYSVNDRTGCGRGRGSGHGARRVAPRNRTLANSAGGTGKGRASRATAGAGDATPLCGMPLCDPPLRVHRVADASRRRDHLPG